MATSGLVYLNQNKMDQKRIREIFHDDSIFYGFNTRDNNLQAWYKPKNSSPYKVCDALSVSHAIHLMKGKVMADRKGAKNLLKEIDEHNEKVQAGVRSEAVEEMKSSLTSIASGRKYFHG